MSSPKRAVAYDFPIALVDSSDTGSFKASPTLATNDFKISKDDGAYVNLATLPTNVPASSINVKIALSATEMTADKIAIQCIDAVGAEWDDVLIFIDATIANIDDVVRSTTPANTLDVTATGAAGIDWGNVENKSSAVDLSGTDIQLCDTVTTNTDMRGTGGRTWYVDIDAAGAGTGFNLTDAFTTIAGATAVAKWGDTIRIADGTYSGAVTFSVAGITIVGESRTATIITHNSAATVTLSVDHLTLKNLKIITTDIGTSAVGVLGASIDSARIDDCWVVGTVGGIKITNSANVDVVRSRIDATFDCVNFQTTDNFLLDACDLISDGSWPTLDVEMRGLFYHSAYGTVRNCKIKINRAVTSAANKATIGIGGDGTLFLEGSNEIVVTATESGYNGDVIGISEAAPPGISFRVFMQGGNIDVSTTGGGTAYDAKTLHADSNYQLAGVNSPGTLEGNVFVISPTALDVWHVLASSVVTASTIGLQLKTNLDLIKAKTDDLTFTKALELDANVQSINDAQVTGDGDATPWDGA